MRPIKEFPIISFHLDTGSRAAADDNFGTVFLALLNSHNALVAQHNALLGLIEGANVPGLSAGSVSSTAAETITEPASLSILGYNCKQCL